MMKFALGSFKDQLKLESEAILLGKVEIRDIPQGFRIMEEDSLKDAALVLVISGCFSVSQKNEEGREQELHLCYAGGLLGQLQVLTGEASIFTVEARVHSKVACLSRQVVFDMMSVQPDVTLQLAMSVISNISSYVRSIDFALDWVLIESGHALYRQVQYSTALYSTAQHSTVHYITGRGGGLHLRGAERPSAQRGAAGRRQEGAGRGVRKVSPSGMSQY